MTGPSPSHHPFPGSEDPDSSSAYFKYYGKLCNQQNMLQDSVRTGAYFQAITGNPSDFINKSVMDVGCGSGILSFFSGLAGAKEVWAIEASNMAEIAKKLGEANSEKFLTGKNCIRVVNKLLEDVGEADGIAPKSVDVLVSEPMGIFLFNERMIESYLSARDRFLKPGGKMFPSKFSLCLAPFSDPVLFQEQVTKKDAAQAFWSQPSFFGLDLSLAAVQAGEEAMRPCIVDYIDPGCLVSPPLSIDFDLHSISIDSLKRIEMPFSFRAQSTSLVHGLAGWFDALFFDGQKEKVILSTSPWSPRTHWYQIRFLLEEPLALNRGEEVQGSLQMIATENQSYKVSFCLRMGNVVRKAENIDLKEPEYRFFSSPNAYHPPIPEPQVASSLYVPPGENTPITRGGGEEDSREPSPRNA